jgi:hypothetical protein
VTDPLPVLSDIPETAADVPAGRRLERQAADDLEETMTETLYKVLGEHGESVNSGTAKWSLPHDGIPGDWMPKVKGTLVPCRNGYHLCREQDLIKWLGPTIYEAEYRGARKDDTDKIVVRQARLIRKVETWNDRTARLFACDCAGWALTLLDHPDARSIEAVRVARLFAVGEATKEQLDAAWAAARAAAWAAARDTAWDAAWAAARAAAWAAAWAAARDAARAAARAWMTERLMQYLRGEE